MADRASRKQELEAKFCELFMLKARAEEQVKTLHDELMRLQGELRGLDRLPDGPAPGPD